MTQAYPLQWPAGWKRTGSNDRQPARFAKREMTHGQHGSWKSNKSLTVADALKRLFKELDLLKASGAIVSTNIETRNDGLPRSDRRTPADPGVAVYFMLAGKDRVLACDKWMVVADNIAAVAGHIDALRKQERYGVGTLEQAFTGYTALPAPDQAKSWRAVMGLGPDATIGDVQQAYRNLIRTRHPDHGGSHDEMAELNAARDEAIRELS